MPIALNQFPTTVSIQNGPYAGDYISENQWGDATWSWYCDDSIVHFTIGTNLDPVVTFHISYELGNGQNDSWYYGIGNRMANPQGFKNINHITPAYRNEANGWRADVDFRRDMRDLATQFVQRVPIDMQIQRGQALRQQRANRQAANAGPVLDGDVLRNLLG